LHGRQEQRHQNANDGDHHEQFDQRKGTSLYEPPCTIRRRPPAGSLVTLVYVLSLLDIPQETSGTSQNHRTISWKRPSVETRARTAGERG
jgi:hypothetical protein